jgi:hypothetical protein
MPPELAIKAAQETYDALRRDYLIASVVILLLVNVAWAYALRSVMVRLTEVQEKRVQDHKEARKEHGELAARMAVHMERSTEAAIHLLREAELMRSKRRGNKDVPALGPEPVSRPKLAGEK